MCYVLHGPPHVQHDVMTAAEMLSSRSRHECWASGCLVDHEAVDDLVGRLQDGVDVHRRSGGTRAIGREEEQVRAARGIAWLIVIERPARENVLCSSLQWFCLCCQYLVDYVRKLTHTACQPSSVEERDTNFMTQGVEF